MNLSLFKIQLWSADIIALDHNQFTWLIHFMGFLYCFIHAKSWHLLYNSFSFYTLVFQIAKLLNQEQKKWCWLRLKSFESKKIPTFQKILSQKYIFLVNLYYIFIHLCFTPDSTYANWKRYIYHTQLESLFAMIKFLAKMQK